MWPQLVIPNHRALVPQGLSLLGGVGGRRQRYCMSYKKRLGTTGLNDRKSVVGVLPQARHASTSSSCGREGKQ